MKLTIELIPSSLFGVNLRTALPSSEWDRLRREVYAAAGHRCELCGGRGPRHPVECHERWEYDEEKHVQRLVGLIALCPACHEVKHFGFATVRGRGEIALAHLMRVNELTREQALAHVAHANEEWARRSAHPWTQDTSWLQARS